MAERKNQGCCPGRCVVVDKSIPMVAHAGCSSDDAAVASLPNDWEPKHSGDILAKYLEERKQNHDQALENITTKACALHHKIDTKVRELAEMLVAQIQSNKNAMECVVNNYAAVKNVSTTEINSDAYKKISELYNQHVEEIAEFKRNGLKLERERADGMRSIMRDQFQRVISIGNFPPKTLLHDFDERMFEINQQLLSNNRAYSEIEAELHADADECVVKSRSALNHLCLNLASGYRNSFDRSKSTVTSSVDSKMRRVSPEPTVFDLRSMKEDIQDCITQLVEIYRQGALKIISSMAGKLMNLHRNLTTNFQCGSHDCVELLSQLDQLVKESVGRVVNTVQKLPPLILHDKLQRFVEVTKDDINNIQTTITTLGQCIQATFLILHDAGHLWDAHVMRLALAQKLTLTAVEDLITNNDNLQQTSEVLFNITFENMCVAPDEDKLNMHYSNLKNMLQNIEDVYLQHSTAEIGRLEQFMNIPPVMANVLLAEFQYFLEKHPRDPIVILEENDMGANAAMADTFLETPIRRAILQTVLQIQALKNWKNGFLETIQYNILWAPDELISQARQWIDSKSTALNCRSSLKKLSHSIRLERVKAAYDKRLAEIRLHEERLKSHINAVTDIVESMPKLISQYLSVDSPELYPLNDWLRRMQESMDTVLLNPDIDPEVRKLKMTSVALRLPKYRELFEESVKRALDEYSLDFHYNFQNARVANVRFLSQIRLMTEGGSYSCVEANKVSAELLKASAAVEACAARCPECLNTRRAQLMAMADECIMSVQKTVEEFVKPGKKGAAEKAQAKKK